MRIKAKVTLLPYIKEGRNENFDVETIPRRFPKNINHFPKQWRCSLFQLQ